MRASVRKVEGGRSPWLVWAAAIALGCGSVCETGEVCERACPTGALAICAAHGLCTCLRGPDGGFEDPAGDQWVDGPDAGFGRDGDPAGGSAACRAPEPGELVINEVMLDGEPTEDGEFVELVNVADDALALGGVTLTSNRGADQVRRVEFTTGCLPSGAALAVFGRRSDWIESSQATPAIEAEVRSFGFANSGDFDFRLVRGETVLDRFEGAGDTIEAGVSLNRWPDRVGEPRLHTAIDPSASLASPGRCPTGGRYEDGCPAPEIAADGGLAGDGGWVAARDGGLDGPHDAAFDAGDAPGPVFDCPSPAPGDLRLNEILIDGLTPRTEADEFVEIVNFGPTARRLAEVALAVQSPDGALDVRVRFADGCLPAGGVMVLRPDIDDWAFDPPPEIPPVVEDARLALGNESRNPIVLLGPSEEPLDRFDPAGLAIVEGVSLNREPDLLGDEWRLHDALAPAPSSPGRCVDGSPFLVDGCAPIERPPLPVCTPANPSRLVINEILVDGARDGETDEFVELVNPTAEPVALAGVSLWSSQADGELVRRVEFVSGCLPPGPLAIFADRGDWLGGVEDIVGRVERWALPNESAIVVELRVGETHWSAEVPRGAAQEGISRVRQTDGAPDAEWQPHDMLSELPASPGLRTDGSPFFDIPDSP